jgi:hypothetical protein
MLAGVVAAMVIGGLVALVALGRGVVVLFGDEYGLVSAYMLIWAPGTNDNCLVKRRIPRGK